MKNLMEWFPSPCGEVMSQRQEKIALSCDVALYVSVPLRGSNESKPYTSAIGDWAVLGFRPLAGK